MRIAHVSLHRDPARRAPEALLRAWPLLTAPPAALRRLGVECSVLQASWTDAELRVGEVPVTFVAERPPGLPALLRARVLASSPDLVHLHGFVHPLRAAWLLRRLERVPVIVQDHAGRPPRSWWRRALLRRAFSQVAAAIFTAREQAAEFVMSGALSPTLPVHEAFEASSTFAPGDRDRARRDTGLHGDPCLLWVGHLNANKDSLTALEGVRRASGALPGLQLWCCYLEAPLLEAVRSRLAADPTLAQRVHLLGARPHEALEAHFRAADAFVLASHREGGNISSIEALACGTPPIVTDLPSFRRITGDGAGGFHFPPGDAGALADAIGRFAAAPRAALRTAARAHFEGRLSYDAMGRRLAAIYRAVLGV